MLEAWTASETALTFTASIVGHADEEAVVKSLQAQVEALIAAVGFDGTACACAPTDYRSVVISVRAADAAAAGVEACLRNKTLVCAGARAAIRLASSVSRHPACVAEAAEPPAVKALDDDLGGLDRDDWALLRRHFLSRVAGRAPDKRSAWTRAVREAARDHADRPWRECRWHEPREEADGDDESKGGSRTDGESKESPRRRVPSFFSRAAPRRPPSRDGGRRREAKEDAGDSKEAEAQPRLAELRRRRRQSFGDSRQLWRLDPDAPDDDGGDEEGGDAKETTAEGRREALPEVPPAGDDAEPRISVISAARALAIVAREAPGVSEVAAEILCKRGASLSGHGERAVLAELAAPTTSSATLEGPREPRLWDDAAANARWRRSRRKTTALRWLSLCRRAVAASWPIVAFAEFARVYSATIVASEYVPPRERDKTPWELRLEREAAERNRRPPLRRYETPARDDARAAPDDEAAALAQFREDVLGGPKAEVQASLVPRAVALRLKKIRPGDDERDVWRIVRDVLRAKGRHASGVLPWTDCATEIWPRIWARYADRWRRPE